jgi:hypothetical protein
VAGSSDGSRGGDLLTFLIRPRRLARLFDFALLAMSQRAPSHCARKRAKRCWSSSRLFAGSKPRCRLILETGYSKQRTGRKFLKLLRHRHTDLLLTELCLRNGVTGCQLEDEAREHLPDLRALFVTRYSENTAAANGFLELGIAMLTRQFAVEARARKMSDIPECERER